MLKHRYLYLLHSLADFLHTHHTVPVHMEQARLQWFRIVKLGQVESPRCPSLLKIAKTAKSASSPEPLGICGWKLAWNISGISVKQNMHSRISWQWIRSLEGLQKWIYVIYVSEHQTKGNTSILQRQEKRHVTSYATNLAKMSVVKGTHCRKISWISLAVILQGGIWRQEKYCCR